MPAKASPSSKTAIEATMPPAYPASTFSAILIEQPASLEVNVSDEGKQPLPAQRPQPGLPPAFRGWGMFLIENLMDEVQVSTEPDGGNQIRMVIYLDR